MANISILILAAGKGTRMKSGLPKVLHSVGGVSLVERVCDTVSALTPFGLGVVIGHQGEKVREKVRGRYPKAKFFTQKTLDGSGGAVRQALAWLKTLKGDVVVTCGDAPLIRAQTFRALLAAHRKQGNVATVLTTVVEKPFGYGRIVRGDDKSVERIVEQLDATEDERLIGEINTGTYCFSAKELAAVLPLLKNANAKKEFYLTDTLELLRRKGGRVGGSVCADAEETVGINSRADLAQAEAALFRRKAADLMAAGVTIVDPASTYIGDQVEIGPDTVVLPQTFILGKTRIGSGCQIGPWAHIADCVFQDNVNFKASFASLAVVRSGSRIGPFSHIRPKSELGPDVHIGNFSEVKNACIGSGSKVNHLSYLGDAIVGKNVNIGAGTITCNYDGVHKHPTTIQDHVFVGSNANLVAPVTLGSHSVIGAGSTICEDVPPWALAVERTRAVVKKNWAKHRMKKKGAGRE